jgi:dolichol-phosphate mannosyltransferase
MPQKLKISIIIPCFNEQEGIPNLAQKLLPTVEQLNNHFNTEIILIDDGSTDNTYFLLNQHFSNIPNTIILKHEKNKNLGGALKTGFKNATGDLIAAYDSDCTYQPEVLKVMIDMMGPETDIITVSPYHPKGKVNNVPPYRLFLSKSISKIYGLLLHTNIHTYTAMVRIYKKEALQNINFESNTFLAVTEIMIKALLQGNRVKELPTTLSVREFGTSKMKTLGVIKDHLGLITKIISYKLFKTRI